MRTQHTRIKDAYGEGSAIVEHVTLDDLAAAWDERLSEAGLDPYAPDAAVARRRLLDYARVMKVSTWGDVYLADHARVDMPRFMAEAGLVTEDAPPESHTVVH